MFGQKSVLRRLHDWSIEAALRELNTTLEQRRLVAEAKSKTAAMRKGRGAITMKAGDKDGWGTLRGVDSSKPVPEIED